jgi:hypothetical protein
VPFYHVYFIDRADHPSRLPEVVECANDQEAMQKARQFVDGQDVELWDGPRFIARFARDSNPTKYEKPSARLHGS